MCGQRLAEGEEVRAECFGEADVVTAEGPAMIHIAMEGGERERQDAPDQRII